jgi:hypothetical protein
MEQRNGRIDRKLQPQPVVYCHYFFYQQRPEDRVLATLVRKTETIQRELGSLAQVVENRLTDLLCRGIHHADVAQLTRELEQADLAAHAKATVAEELDATRDRRQALSEQIEWLRDRLAKAQQRPNFREEPFRAALSAALQLQGAAGLQPSARPTESGLPRFTLPVDVLRRDPT